MIKTSKTGCSNHRLSIDFPLVKSPARSKLMMCKSRCRRSRNLRRRVKEEFSVHLMIYMQFLLSTEFNSWMNTLAFDIPTLHPFWFQLNWCILSHLSKMIQDVLRQELQDASQNLFYDFVKSPVGSKKGTTPCRRYKDDLSICPSCQQPADLDHWNWQCPVQASNIHTCGGIPRDPLQRRLGWPIGHFNDDKIIQHMVTRREQAISWCLHNRRSADPSDEGDSF